MKVDVAFKEITENFGVAFKDVNMASGKDGEDGYSIYKCTYDFSNDNAKPGSQNLYLNPKGIATGENTIKVNDFVIVETYLYKVIVYGMVSGVVTLELVTNLKGTDGYSIYQYIENSAFPTVTKPGAETLNLIPTYIVTGGNKVKVNDYVLVETYLYKITEIYTTSVTAKLVANLKGEQGAAGKIKFNVVNELPTEDIDENAIYLKPVDNPQGTNTYEEFIYVNGVWESLGTASVEVDLTGYVKNTDYPTSSTAGVVRSTSSYGTIISYGTVRTNKATESDIDAKTDQYKPIVPQKLDYAVKTSLVSNSITLTDEEKAAIKAWLGIAT